jgi:tetratricopeptide (TPR) repeat protein
MRLLPASMATQIMTAILGISLLAIGLLPPSSARAHETIDKDIDRLSTAIARAPGRAELRLHRAEMHRLRQDWAAARDDLETARDLGADATRLGLCWAALHLDMGEARRALEPLDRVIEKKPDETALLLRSRARTGVGDRPGAIADLDRALALSTTPQPESYLERARLLMEGGEASWLAALEGLEAGLERLGPVVSLVFPAVDLEEKLGRHDAALARLAMLEPQYDHKSGLLVRRAEILERAGREMEAQACYTEALAVLEALPSHQRRSAATSKLEHRIRQALTVRHGTSQGEPGE